MRAGRSLLRSVVEANDTQSRMLLEIGGLGLFKLRIMYRSDR